MHRIEVPSATADHKFTEGSPTGGIPATVVSASWLNDLQENVCEAIEGAGITLVPDNSFQLLQAISALALLTLPKRVFADNDFIRIPDVAGGLIIQWGLVSSIPATSTADTSLPTAFPNQFRGLIAGHGSSNINRVGPLGATKISLSALRVANSDNQIASAYYIAWGN